MITNVSQYVDVAARRTPEKVAFSNGTRSMTYKELRKAATNLASKILDLSPSGSRVLVLMDRTPEMVAAMFGLWYAGDCVVPVDAALPLARIQSMARRSNARIMIYDERYAHIACSIEGVVSIAYTDAIFEQNDDGRIERIQQRAVDTDPAYIIFTSGSSGEPKGTVSSHRCLINFAEALCDELDYKDDYILAGQTPLYYIASLHDIMPGVRLGLTVYLLPNEILLFPIRIVDFLFNNRINVLSVVPSVLSRFAAYVDFDKHPLPDLKCILYGGESLSTEKMKRLINGLPQATICCCYGLTEVTTTSCLWKSNTRPLDDDEVVPIGYPLKNTKIFLLDENEQESWSEGEVCFAGACLASGYYNDSEQTHNRFCQNPLHDSYPEMIYRTGDIAKYNRYGELVFVGRKDSQIKRGGHRIELGDIEAVALQNPAIDLVCCVFLKESEKIDLCYTGSISDGELLAFIKLNLPSYMVPTRIIQVEKMPLLSNGKINRKEVFEIVKREEGV